MKFYLSSDFFSKELKKNNIENVGQSIKTSRRIQNVFLESLLHQYVDKREKCSNRKILVSTAEFTRINFNDQSGWSITNDN